MFFQRSVTVLSSLSILRLILSLRNCGKQVWEGGLGRIGVSAGGGGPQMRRAANGGNLAAPPRKSRRGNGRVGARGRGRRVGWGGGGRGRGWKGRAMRLPVAPAPRGRPINSLPVPPRPSQPSSALPSPPVRGAMHHIWERRQGRGGRGRAWKSVALKAGRRGRKLITPLSVSLEYGGRKGVRVGWMRGRSGG